MYLLVRSCAGLTVRESDALCIKLFDELFKAGYFVDDIEDEVYECTDPPMIHCSVVFKDYDRAGEHSLEDIGRRLICLTGVLCTIVCNAKDPNDVFPLEKHFNS